MCLVDRCGHRLELAALDELSGVTPHAERDVG